MHKNRKVNANLTYDIHIVEALKNLPVPLLTFDGHKVYFDEDKRNETIYEHIANKNHHLHVVDIKKIQTILLDEFSLVEDKNGISFRTYIGLRGKKNESSKYLQITTRLKKDNIESIITIYPTKIKRW